MEHFFDLPVLYKGEELLLKGRLVTFAYSYKFFVVVNGKELTFERDDERVFRVLSGAGEDVSTIDRELVQQIISALNKI
ncbi:hypothetical protein [Niabella soli]|uniref:Uncharacterized protein n=1 Tax=Niabella soli DSM 19437 TaxID=929713 RepID=W0F5M0_9BACT|nr:hypothetical protein [Niabella soli]AHF17123.1 hypothetical protein NIASO_02145 [Niabella soli DSM 19437]